MYFRIGERLTPVYGKSADDWDGLAAVLTPEELAGAGLPPCALPPEILQSHESFRGCKLVIEDGRVWGELHIPAGAGRTFKRLSFVWWKNNILFIDRGGTAALCMEKISAMRPHHAGAADDLLMDFFLALISDDLSAIQALEDRIAALEQAVLESRTQKFINRMSLLRMELNNRNRYYAQLNNLALALQENASDLLDADSQSRLNYVLRRLNRLQDETQLLREYASQVSSEYQAQVDIAQNRIMKLLTIVTTIFMPLSLIAGWYGMNFANMPELNWPYGYPAVIALSALIVLGCVAYFRRKHFW